MRPRLLSASIAGGPRLLRASRTRSGRRRIRSDTYELRFGIDNLADVEPNIYGATPTTTGNGLTLNEFYDVLGRRYYVGFRARF